LEKEIYLTSLIFPKLADTLDTIFFTDGWFRMIKVTEKLYIARCSESVQNRLPAAAHIYCCQQPCSRTSAQLPPALCTAGAPEAPREFISLVNTEIPYYQAADFNHHLDLLDRRLHGGEVVLLSEHGESRAPSLALLWMVFRGKLLSKSSFAAARADFSRIYPKYLPWPGWVIFFEQEWDAFH
jgi:hypothetical protein